MTRRIRFKAWATRALAAVVWVIVAALAIPAFQFFHITNAAWDAAATWIKGTARDFRIITRLFWKMQNSAADICDANAVRPTSPDPKGD